MSFDLDKDFQFELDVVSEVWLPVVITYGEMAIVKQEIDQTMAGKDVMQQL